MYDSQAPAAYSPVSEISALDEFSAMESPSGVIAAAELLEEEAETEGALALQVEPMPEATEPLMLPESMQGVIGLSESLVEVYRVIDRVADTTCTILITGDSGTGKELVARAVHRKSQRANKAFVAVNCGAIPEALLESELFGHARGAFTGAHANKIGRIALAEGGTLFLDEIGEMPLSLQVKLLRVLQAREYSPVGDNRTLKADVRIVAATNVNLENAVQAGTFREDLYYRLNVFPITMPPLRERPGDIALLVEHFIAKYAQSTGKVVRGADTAAIAMLSSYPWLGNVRELENVIERALILAMSDVLTPADLDFGRRQAQAVPAAPLAASPSGSLSDSGRSLHKRLSEQERNEIVAAVEHSQGNIAHAARALGINRSTLYYRMRKHGLEHLLPTREEPSDANAAPAEGSS